MKNWKSRLAAALALAAVCGVLPDASRFATITVTASAAPAILPIRFREISSTATNFTISGTEVDGWYEFVWATNLLSGFTNKLVFQATGSTMTVDFPRRRHVRHLVRLRPLRFHRFHSPGSGNLHGGHCGRHAGKRSFELHPDPWRR